MKLHVILYVADQAASAAFYSEVLGVDPRLNVPGMTELELGEAVLGLMPEAGIERLLPDVNTGRPRSRAPRRSEQRPSRAELYLVVDDPGSMHARALAAGAQEMSPLGPRDWGDDAAYARDLDGHILAFARRSTLDAESADEESQVEDPSDT